MAIHLAQVDLADPAAGRAHIVEPRASCGDRRSDGWKEERSLRAFQISTTLRARVTMPCSAAARAASWAACSARVSFSHLRRLMRRDMSVRVSRIENETLVPHNPSLGGIALDAVDFDVHTIADVSPMPAARS